MQPLCSALDDDQKLALTEAGAVVHDIGSTVDGHPLIGYSIGKQELPLVSIVAGAHPDEPAGPLAALALAQRYEQSPILQRVRLAVVPQLDIDGVYLQRAWLRHSSLDPKLFFTSRIRRLPGEDREFAWPGSPWNGCVLPESRAADDFLNEHEPAIAHLSLHGMAVAEGAWFLLDHLAMTDAPLWQELRAIADKAQLGLHDSPRFGDKGFRRCAKGFCTTPSGPAMRRWALATEQAFKNGFGYGSMDAARKRARTAHAPPPLCAVSEFPLLAIHDSGDDAWRDALNELVLAVDFDDAFAQLQKTYAIEIVAYEKQVLAMCAMCEAVIAAALRRYT